MAAYTALGISSCHEPISAEEAYAKRQVLEEKIRVAQARMAMRTPLEILRDTKDK